MNRFKCILLVFLIISNCHLFGDIIPTKHPPTLILAMIDNLDEYPDIAIVGVSDCRARPSAGKGYIFEPDSSLRLHKSCVAKVYAVKKDYLEKKNPAKIEWEKDENVIPSNLIINEMYVSSFKFVSVDESHYRIAGFNDEGIVLYMSSRVFKYDGEPSDVRHFEYNGDLTKLRKTF